MKFSVIIPTYKRPEKLIRALDSVTTQSALLDVQIIIINDSPDFDYSFVEQYISKIDTTYTVVYVKNEENRGVNFSRNKAFEYVDVDTDYVVFLDDDDWFGENALSDMALEINQRKKPDWLLTHRVKESESLTKVQSSKKEYSYFLDYLLFKKIQGDATHCIARELAVKARFSSKIKNGEEWFYFIQIPSKITYAPLSTTMSEGYEEGGLNAHMQDTYKKNTKHLFSEVKNCKAIVYLTIRWLYGIFR